MSVSVTLNGISYTLPTTGDTSWGSAMTSWAQAVSSSTLQKSGGTFTLTADLNFGTVGKLTAAGIKDSTRAYARYTINSGTGQTITNNTATVINFTELVLDSRTAVTTGAAWKFTVPAGHAGLYLVSTVLTIAAGTSGVWNALLHKNGTQYCALGRKTAVTTTDSIDGSAIISLAAGDYIDIRGFQDSGVSKTLHNDPSYNHVHVVRLLADI